jgi:hypothetical protein
MKLKARINFMLTIGFCYTGEGGRESRIKSRESRREDQQARIKTELFVLIGTSLKKDSKKKSPLSGGDLEGAQILFNKLCWLAVCKSRQTWLSSVSGLAACRPQ